MPPPFPTTSPLAVAATRILAAYLSNHRLSPAEAASLGGTIAEALASLTRDASVKNNTPLALAEEPAPRRQVKPRVPRQAQAAEALPPPIPEPIAELEPEPEPEAESEPILASEPEMAEAAEVPRKRKRPSRPRSRRGKASEPPEDPVIEAAPEPVLAETAAEEPAVAPTPRRAAGRPRRVTIV